jgi:hypothetical protein
MSECSVIELKARYFLEIGLVHHYYGHDSKAKVVHIKIGIFRAISEANWP